MDQPLIDIDLNGHKVSVRSMAGYKKPYVGSTTVYEIHTNELDAQSLRKSWSLHECVPLSEDDDTYGKRITQCHEVKSGVYQLTVFEPYTD